MIPEKEKELKNNMLFFLNTDKVTAATTLIFCKKRIKIKNRAELLVLIGSIDALSQAMKELLPLCCEEVS